MHLYTILRGQFRVSRETIPKVHPTGQKARAIKGKSRC